MIILRKLALVTFLLLPLAANAELKTVYFDFTVDRILSDGDGLYAANGIAAGNKYSGNFVYDDASTNRSDPNGETGDMWNYLSFSSNLPGALRPGGIEAYYAGAGAAGWSLGGFWRFGIIGGGVSFVFDEEDWDLGYDLIDFGTGLNHPILPPPVFGLPTNGELNYALNDGDDTAQRAELSVTFYSEPQTEPITIDIKPGDDPNDINPTGKQRIPVAVLATDTFDATQVDWKTVSFGSGEATEYHERAHIEDVDLDGDMDMVLHFDTPDTGIACSGATPITYDESVSGDLLGYAGGVKPHLILGSGANSVIGTFTSVNLPNVADDDMDSFYFTVAAGYALDSIVVDFALQDVGSGIIEAHSYMRTDLPFWEPYLYQWFSIPPSSLNLFDSALPLGRGTYDLGVGNDFRILAPGDGQPVAYTLTLNVSPTPEATLTGETFSGKFIVGKDSIVTVNCD